MKRKRHLFTEKELLSQFVVIVEGEYFMIPDEFFGIDGHGL